MGSIAEYVQLHTRRGECKCGLCCDRGDAPDPSGHTVDMVFFKVAVENEPTADEFKALTKAHAGDFANCDPLDRKEHGYMELGAWIGDQGLAMLYMALGVALGVFKLFSPRMLGLDDETAMMMAQNGMLSVISR